MFFVLLRTKFQERDLIDFVQEGCRIGMLHLNQECGRVKSFFKYCNTESVLTMMNDYDSLPLNNVEYSFTFWTVLTTNSGHTKRGVTTICSKNFDKARDGPISPKG
jgi:hypothetical protein